MPTSRSEIFLRVERARTQWRLAVPALDFRGVMLIDLSGDIAILKKYLRTRVSRPMQQMSSIASAKPRKCAGWTPVESIQ